ncbi:hypothetical protein [Actinomadura monticuli]|uniref:Uncharacterized protein n=1 Tax=Actinomadura monticuli TaxID=3097367 RepID=A0ABV4Q5R4_9ACTN
MLAEENHTRLGNTGGQFAEHGFGGYDRLKAIHAPILARPRPLGGGVLILLEGDGTPQRLAG